jgi:hypothetical protein
MTWSTAARARIVLTVLTCASFIAVAANAAEPAKKPFTRGDLRQFTATVQSVDQAKRSIVLAGPSGDREEFTVGPEVRNLSRVKAGDRVEMSYYVGVAAQLQPRGTAAQGPQATEAMRTAPAGERPSGSASRTVSATVTVDSVDASANTVSFKGADGVAHTVAVEDPEAREALKSLRAGDAVKITYREAMAVAVKTALR